MNLHKITFLISSLGGGGAERVVSILANDCVARGYDVDIVMVVGHTIAYSINPGIKIIDYSEPENRNYVTKIWHLVKKFRLYLRYNKPDKIISFLTEVNMIGLTAALGLNENFYISVRNDPCYDGNKYINKLASWMYSFSNCKRIIFQTEYQKFRFPVKIGKKGIVINNPIILSAQRKKSVHKIVSVGRFFPQKNQKMLIQAFAEIAIKNPDYQLIIYGEGPLRQELEELICELQLENRVFLPGFRKNIHALISDAEMFVLSSDYEGLSNALLEALCMGIPCITTNVSGIDEVIKDKINGILVPPRNTEKLIQAMELLINNPELRQKISHKGIETGKNFSSDFICEEWFKGIFE